jgi:hypothetical protein
MSIKQLWYRIVYRYSKYTMTRKGLWLPNQSGVKSLLVHLQRFAPVLPTTDWRPVDVVSQWRSVDGFLKHLTIATEIIGLEGDVLEPRSLLREKGLIQLYDFFVTEQRQPLTMAEVVKALDVSVTKFLTALDKCSKTSPFRYNYYIRRYGALLEASFSFAQTLCGLASRE